MRFFANQGLHVHIQDVSWISLHTAGKVIIEMRDSPIPVLHIVNPHPISWSVISKTIANELSVPLVPYAEWLHCLEKGFTEHDNAARGNGRGDNPALPLIDYFRAAATGGANKEAFALPRLDIQRAVKISPSLRNAEMLTPEDALRWIQWWKQEGNL